MCIVIRKIHLISSAHSDRQINRAPAYVSQTDEKNCAPRAQHIRRYVNGGEAVRSDERGDEIPLEVRARERHRKLSPSEVFNVSHVRARGRTLKAFNERASSHLRRSTLPRGTSGIRRVRREKDAPRENVAWRGEARRGEARARARGSERGGQVGGANVGRGSAHTPHSHIHTHLDTCLR